MMSRERLTPFRSIGQATIRSDMVVSLLQSDCSSWLPVRGFGEASTSFGGDKANALL